MGVCPSKGSIFKCFDMQHVFSPVSDVGEPILMNSDAIHEDDRYQVRAELNVTPSLVSMTPSISFDYPAEECCIEHTETVLLHRENDSEGCSACHRDAIDNFALDGLSSNMAVVQPDLHLFDVLDKVTLLSV